MPILAATAILSALFIDMHGVTASGPIGRPAISPAPPAVGLSGQVSAIITEAGFEDLSEDVIERVKLSFLDSVMNIALATCRVADAPFLDRIIAKGGVGESSLPGGNSLPMDEVAAYYAYLIHAFETDETDHRASLRASPVVIAAALSVSDALDSSGEEIIAAVASGYSVLGALAAPRGPMQLRGWMSSGVYGAISSAVVASKLMELDAEEMANAISLAAASSSGLFQYYFDQTEEKRIIIARAARLGVEAALLAAEGEQGAPQALEGRSGLYQVMSGTPLKDDEVEAILAATLPLDGPLFLDPKFYATSDSIIPFLEGLDQQSVHFDPDAIDSISVIGDDRAASILERKIQNFVPPATVIGAKLNLSFVLSLFLHTGEVTPASFTDEQLQSEEIIDLARRVRFLRDPDTTVPSLKLQLDSGEAISINAVLDDPSSTVDAQLERRMTKIESFTNALWTPTERGEVIDVVMALDEVQRASQWVNQLQSSMCEIESMEAE